MLVVPFPQVQEDLDVYMRLNYNHYVITLPERHHPYQHTKKSVCMYVAKKVRYHKVFKMVSFFVTLELFVLPAGHSKLLEGGAQKGV